MLVSVILDFVCPCGATAKGVMVKQLRINKNSMRTLGQALGLMPRTCKACGKALPDTLPVAARLADDDLVKVNAYRERKGWPPLPDIPDALAEATQTAAGAPAPAPADGADTACDSPAGDAAPAPAPPPPPAGGAGVTPRISTVQVGGRG